VEAEAGMAWFPDDETTAEPENHLIRKDGAKEGKMSAPSKAYLIQLVTL